MSKGRTGALVLSIILLPGLLAGQDRSKKAYELIYEDIQALKAQVSFLEEKVGQAAEGVEALRAEMSDLRAMVKALQGDQSTLSENVRNVPSQYNYLLDRIGQINLALDKIAQDILIIRGGQPLIPISGPEPKPGSPPPATDKKTPDAKKKEAPNAPPPQPTSLSPQEVYNTSYADYLKGNFELAVDGFKMYRENFPDSPLADNALYWIGECHYSLRKFEEAINEFNDLILNYPQSDKIAASYLKKGLALAELKKKDEALVVFRLLVSKFPLDEEAKIAQEKIKEMAGK
jgi:tol-pal system protein YbgF